MVKLVWFIRDSEVGANLTRDVTSTLHRVRNERELLTRPNATVCIWLLTLLAKAKHPAFMDTAVLDALVTLCKRRSVHRGTVFALMAQLLFEHSRLHPGSKLHSKSCAVVRVYAAGAACS